MKRTLLLTCSIQVLDESIGIKIFKNEDEDGFVNYTFTQSHFLQDESHGAPYRPGSGAIAPDLEHLLYRIENVYKQQFRKIVNKVVNPDY